MTDQEWYRRRPSPSPTGQPPPEPAESVHHPTHYGGADNPYEAIRVIDAWGLGFSLGNALKYLCRAGHKPGASRLEDLEKAAWYIGREIQREKDKQMPDAPLRFQRLHSHAKPPEKAHDGDLGFDLFTTDPITCRAGQVTAILTGVAVGFPPGVGGLVLGRSGLAKRGLHPVGGVIDSGYTGEIVVLMVNATQGDYEFLAGERIAQLVLVPVLNPPVIEVDRLDATDRGDRGFGSTGR